MSERVDYEREGYEAGKSAGSWVTDGFNDTSQYRWILKGIEEGDLEVMDLEPLPLSRERASESIGELIEGYADMPDDGVEQDAACTEYDQAFSQGFWHEVERSCRLQVELTVPLLNRADRFRMEWWPAVAFYVVDQWSDRATVVMVGDDREHDVDVSELVPIGEGDYCGECGQIGCSFNGRDER